MEQIVKQWALAWSERRSAELANIYASGAAFRTAGMTKSFFGSQRLSEFSNKLGAVSPATKIEVEEILEAKDGQSVAVVWRTHAANPLDPSRTTAQKGISRLKISGDKIVDEETVFDRLDLLADVMAAKKTGLGRE